jgi:hypothetical protein
MDRSLALQTAAETKETALRTELGTAQIPAGRPAHKMERDLAADPVAGEKDVGADAISSTFEYDAKIPMK